MSLKLLRVQRFRNLEDLELVPAPGLNVLTGRNGSGKTSVLEAIYFLGRGKSFRSSRHGPLLKRGAQDFVLFARVGARCGTEHDVGVEQGTKGHRFKIDGTAVRRASELLSVVPAQLITPRSHELFDQGAEYRRRFLDLGVFHVEHRFYDAYVRYLKGLRQRNVALRAGFAEASVWDGELSRLAVLIHEWRSAYVAKLQDGFSRYMGVFLPYAKGVAIRLSAGWEIERALDSVLADNFRSDQKRGFTHFGPHRANWGLRTLEGDFSATASSGEKKMALVAVVLARIELMAERGVDSVLLFDDLPSEFDRENRGKVLREINRLGCQSVITGTDRDFLDGIEVERKMFHVEQGRLVDI